MGTSSWNFHDFLFKMGGLLMCFSKHVQRRMKETSGVPRGVFGGFKPPREIPKALQNRAKIKPIVKTVKNC